MIERAGATNAAATGNIDGWGQISSEVLVAENPDWLIINRGSSVPAGPGYNATTAVQENQTVAVNPNHLNRPGPRVVYAIQTMTETFHPEAYAAANASDAQTTDEPSTAPPDTPTPTQGGDGAGFGVIAVLIAGGVGTLLTRARA